MTLCENITWNRNEIINGLGILFWEHNFIFIFRKSHSCDSRSFSFVPFTWCMVVVDNVRDLCQWVNNFMDAISEMFSAPFLRNRGPEWLLSNIFKQFETTSYIRTVQPNTDTASNACATLWLVESIRVLEVQSLSEHLIGGCHYYNGRQPVSFNNRPDW